jgi:hypothetical protein
VTDAVLRVVHGGVPDDAELAALVVALAAMQARAATAAVSASPSRWAARSASQRRPLPHGADAWRWSLP